MAVMLCLFLSHSPICHFVLSLQLKYRRNCIGLRKLLLKLFNFEEEFPFHFFPISTQLEDKVRVPPTNVNDLYLNISVVLLPLPIGITDTLAY